MRIFKQDHHRIIMFHLFLILVKYDDEINPFRHSDVALRMVNFFKRKNKIISTKKKGNFYITVMELKKDFDEVFEFVLLFHQLVLMLMLVLQDFD